MSHADPPLREVWVRDSTLASTEDTEGLCHLPRPVTVRLDRPVWPYNCTVLAIHAAALAAFIPWVFRNYPRTAQTAWNLLELRLEGT